MKKKIRLVHCHLCSMKDYCTVGHPKTSWLYQHPDPKKKMSEEERNTMIQKLLESTNSCPIKIMLKLD